MSSFFQDDGDSDEERGETQRRTLERIRQDLQLSKRTEETSSPSIPSQKEQERSEIQGVTEEQELEVLRRNVRYNEYAINSRKRAELAQERERKRQRVDVETDDASDHENEADDVHSTAIEPPLESAGASDAKEREKDVDYSERRRTSTANSSNRHNRTKPKLDPKIIADSSDESSGDEDESDDEAPLGPALPPASQSTNWNLSNIEDLPIHNQATLGTVHASYVSCLALDASGTRLVSGSLDSTAKFWDFHAMNRSLRSFRSVTPIFDSPVRSIQYSSTGRALLFSGGLNSAVITDREGVILSQTAKGDMYIVDSSRTKGHTGPILAAKWKPSGGAPSAVVVTTSADATLRVWNIERTRRVPMVDHPIVAQERITKLRNQKGGKIVASAFDWLPDEKSCALGCSDGRLRIIDPSSYALRPQDETQSVLANGEEITSVVCAPNSCAAPLVLVRGSDDTLRVFDRRMFSRPVKEFGDLPNSISETNACFIGETGENFMTGTSASRKRGTSKGSVRVFDTRRLEEVWKSELEEGAGSAVCTLWHPSINQCVIGTGDGKVHVMYHSEKSQRGILSCLSKTDYRKTHGVVNLGYGEALPASSVHVRGRSATLHEGGDTNGRSKGQKRELSKARKPKQLTGPPSALQKTPTSMTQHLVSKEMSSRLAQDPREAILKYADVAKRDPQFTKAYQKTQPETILAEKTAEQEEEDTRKAIYDRDRTKRIKP